jgi:HEAT repeat protein
VKTSESSRIRVWASITLMVGLYVAAVYWVYRTSSGTSQAIARLVPLATGLAVVPLVLVIMLAIFSIIAKSFRYVARVQAARVSPEIREALASVVVGDGDRERLRSLAHHHRRPFEAIFTEFLCSFGGQINSELSVLAVELGFAEKWRQATRSRNFLVQKIALANLGRIGCAIEPRFLRHPLEQTRIEAACAFLASGSPDAPEQVFKMLPDQSLLGRILLADSLRPFAVAICEKYLADGIKSTDVRRARASVDLLRAWERWIPMDNFSSLVAGRDIDLRVAAVSALRYASATEEEATQEIFNLLHFPDESVHAPAAKAALDMGITALIPVLLNQLRTDGPVAALAAAQALAGMGSEGKDLLESEIFSSERPHYALQALEQSLVAERG